MMTIDELYRKIHGLNSSDLISGKKLNVFEDLMREFIGEDDEAGTDDPNMPPSPDEIALTLVQGMLASGTFKDNEHAVFGLAWASVPHYYIERQKYPMYAQMLINFSPDDGEEPSNTEEQGL